MPEVFHPQTGRMRTRTGFKAVAYDPQTEEKSDQSLAKAITCDHKGTGINQTTNGPMATVFGPQRAETLNQIYIFYPQTREKSD